MLDLTKVKTWITTLVKPSLTKQDTWNALRVRIQERTQYAITEALLNTNQLTVFHFAIWDTTLTPH
jgi:hypothetical protein